MFLSNDKSYFGRLEYENAICSTPSFFISGFRAFWLKTQVGFDFGENQKYACSCPIFNSLWDDTKGCQIFKFDPNRWLFNMQASQELGEIIINAAILSCHHYKLLQSFWFFVHFIRLYAVYSKIAPMKIEHVECRKQNTTLKMCTSFRASSRSLCWRWFFSFVCFLFICSCCLIASHTHGIRAKYGESKRSNNNHNIVKSNSDTQCARIFCETKFIFNL